MPAATGPRHRHRSARLRLGRQLPGRQHQPTRRRRHRHLQRLQRQQGQHLASAGHRHRWIGPRLGHELPRLVDHRTGRFGRKLTRTDPLAHRRMGERRRFELRLCGCNRRERQPMDGEQRHQYPDRDRRPGDPREDSPVRPGADALGPCRQAFGLEMIPPRPI